MDNKICDGWILQKSTSNPGKFYYFNINNGQSLWTLNNAEQASTHNDFKTDNKHYFPKPRSPPLPICYTTKFCCMHGKLKDTPDETKVVDTPVITPNPLFNNVFFQTPFSNDEKDIYTTPKKQDLRPFVNPIVFKQNPVFGSNNAPTPVFDFKKTTPTREFCSSFFNEEKKENNVFSRGITSVNRINGCENTSSGIKLKEPVLKESCNNRNVVDDNKTKFDMFLKEASNAFQTKCRLNSETKVSNPFLMSRMIFPQSVYPKMSVTTNIFKDTTKNPSITTNINCLVSHSNKTELSNNQDLRKILNSRKRSLNAKESNLDDNFKGKVIRTKFPFQKHVTQRKCVTFNMVDQFDNGNHSKGDILLDPMVNITCQQVKENLPKKAILQQLREFAKPLMRKDVWYVAVDSVVLLEDYDFIDSFVQQDRQCRLLITDPVRSDITMMSSGRSLGRQRVMIARQIAKKLLNPPHHIFLQPNPENGNSPFNSSMDSIIYNCQQIMDQKYHVVLVSNSTGLLAKAKFNDIPCQKLQDMKNIITAMQSRMEQTEQFDNKEINNNSDEDLSSKIDIDIPVNMFRKQMFASQ